MTAISSVYGRRVWDSRGNPTVEVDVRLENGCLGRAIAPAGASRGKREAIDLRDGGRALRGMDVSRAIRNVNGPIAAALTGLEAVDQRSVDRALLELDPTPMKETLGGNATVAASLSVLHAAAKSERIPVWRRMADLYGETPSVPLPEIQIFGGGAHARQRVDIQDFMIMVPGANDFEEVMEIANEVYFAAGDIMSSRGLNSGVCDEGGWWPAFGSNEEALETLVLAIEKAGEKPGGRVVVSLDVAASEFGENGEYRLALEGRSLTTEGLIDLLARWLDSYPIVSLEDPVGEDDPEGMAEFTRRFGDRIQIVGDDFLVTRATRVIDAAKAGACNALLVKVNQVGTVTEAVEAYKAAKEIGWGAIVSARSGETEDVSISHLAVGLGCGQLKVGSLQRSERMAKWNECLRIQEDLGAGRFVGAAPLAGTWWARETKGGQ